MNLPRGNQLTVRDPVGFEPLSAVIEKHIRKVLIASRYKVRKAAERLKIPRSRLYRYVDKYKIKLPPRHKRVRGKYDEWE